MPSFYPRHPKSLSWPLPALIQEVFSDERGLEQKALNVTTCQRNSHLVGPVGLVLKRHPQPHAFSPRLTSAAKGCLLLLDTCNEIRFSMKTEGKMRSENAPGED